MKGFFPFFKKRFYLFIFREKEREGERERNINLQEKHHLVASYPAQQGTWMQPKDVA